MPDQLQDMRFVYRGMKGQDRTAAHRAMRQFLVTRPAEFVKTMAALEEDYRKLCEEYLAKQAAAAAGDVPGGVGPSEGVLRKTIDGLLAKWGA